MSPQHRRYATLAELVEILAEKSHYGYMLGKRATGTESRLTESGEEVMVPFEQLSEASKDISRAAAAAMLDGLADLGVPVTTLVKITNGGERVEPVNLTERPEDTVVRFAGHLQYARELLDQARAMLEGTAPGDGTDDFVTRVRLFPHKPEDHR